MCRSENFFAQIVEVVLVKFRNVLRESKSVELFHHPFFHLGGGVVGECDGQNALEISARGTFKMAMVQLIGKTSQMRFEAGGEIVEHQIVGFSGACGGGIDSEHWKG